MNYIYPFLSKKHPAIVHFDNHVKIKLLKRFQNFPKSDKAT